jgi:LPXTG-motif cell wall-anchored protein
VPTRAGDVEHGATIGWAEARQQTLRDRRSIGHGAIVPIACGEVRRTESEVSGTNRSCGRLPQVNGRLVLRTAIVCAIAASLVSMVVSLQPSDAQVAPTRPLDTDINDYVVFGFQTVAIKGSDIAGRGEIRGGNIGANGIDAQLRSRGILRSSLDATVNICANKHITMSEGSQVVGDTVRFSSDCTFWDLFANNIIGEGGGTTHAIVQPVGAFPKVAVPPFPSFGCTAGNDVTVRKGAPAFALAPGSYGAVESQDATTITLSAGVYEMCSLHLGQNVTFRAAVGTILYITGSLNIGNGTRFALDAACGLHAYVGGQGVGANDASINFGKNTQAAGHFFTLGRINLGNGNDLFGTFWGEHIISDFDIDVTYCPPIGEFPIVKHITGSGAGQQGEIRFDITCVPNPPNTTPIPPFIIPPGATGSPSTIITGVTIPAACTVTETATGDNEVVDVIQQPGVRGRAGPNGSLCPAFVARVLSAPNPEEQQTLPPVTFVNVIETTSTTTTTAPTTTTAAPTTTNPEETTTTAAPTTTTTTTTTTVAPSTTTSPPDTSIECILPTLPIDSTLPETGANGVNHPLVGALSATALGALLLLVVRRRRAA